MTVVPRDIWYGCKISIRTLLRRYGCPKLNWPIGLSEGSKIMRKSQTIDRRKPFYYEGDLAHGLVVRTSDHNGNANMSVNIYISSEEIKIIKNKIKGAGEILMGACRDNPAPNSLGHMLLYQHKKSPQHLSYVIPLLVEEGFCMTYKDGRSIVIRYMTDRQQKNGLVGLKMARANIEGVDRRINQLCSDFSFYIHEFDMAQPYTGPSVYFHLKTIERLGELQRPLIAAKDHRFLEYLYATLAAWGMHRMGRSGAKMVDFKSFAVSIADRAPAIDELKNEQTYALPQGTTSVADKLWALITELRGSATESKLVANSKILHHLLPELVPPIDRQHTARFFNYQIQNREEKAFYEIFPRMVSIAQRVKDDLAPYIGHGFHSSSTKVIDNAIIGFSKRHLRS